jgi:membrane-bound lytic murein transglycosylase F
VALALASLGATLPIRADDSAENPAKPAGAAPAVAKQPLPTARLPRRLAADFHQHIQTRLPHLRPAFEAAAQETGIDWRTLAALGYQESRWKPNAQSHRGAQGVMMLMPVTARKMGVTNVFEPTENIMAGARYLAYLRSRIPKRIKDPDRTLLAMAAYNMGSGHLEDARIITQMRKKNPDRWSDVRANLHRLQDPHWHSRVKHGYARGEETAQLVERVAQFAAILEVAAPDQAVARADAPQ